MSQPRTGRIVQVDARQVHVELEPFGADAQVVRATLRGQLFEDLGDLKNPVAVGDRVELTEAPDGDAGLSFGVERVLPRANHLSRVASGHDPREQVLVANVDQLLLISAVRQPGFSSNRTDRILAACDWHEIPAILVLNKIDLAERAEIDALRATYESLPIPVLETCAKDGRGVDELKELLRDKVTVLYGPSGAGKSTLINRVQPGLNLKEGNISRFWQQGRHTTTHSRLLHLELGGWVVDTPGIRVFRLFDVNKAELRDLFPDFLRFAPECRFPDCSHDHEPDCAVRRAVDEERLSDTRYASYLEMLDEAEPPQLGDDEPLGPMDV